MATAGAFRQMLLGRRPMVVAKARFSQIGWEGEGDRIHLAQLGGRLGRQR